MNKSTISTPIHTRWLALDRAKGIGVLAMVFTHTLVWWHIYPVGRLEPQYADAFSVIFILGGLLVMLLPISAGASLRFAWQKYWDADRRTFLAKQAPPFKVILIRCVTLLGVASLINVLAWGIEALFIWNVLHFFSVALIVLYTLFKVGNIFWLYILGVVSFLSTFFYPLIMSLNSDAWWVIILLGNTDTYHIWPLLPWVSIVIFGFVVADYYISTARQLPSLKLVAGAGAAVLLVALAQGLLNIDVRLGPDQMWDIAIHPPTVLVLAAFGLFLLVIASLEKITTRGGLLAKIGQAVTYAYFFHVTIGFWLIATVFRMQTGFDYFLYVLALQLLIVLVVAYGLQYFRLKSAYKQSSELRE